MGDSDNPGLILNTDGYISQINIGVTADFKLSGLSLSVNKLTFEWQENSNMYGTQIYHISGDAKLIIEDDYLDADFGDSDNPGIIIKGGVLNYLNVDINSDIKLGNLEVETKDLDLIYDNSTKIFSVTGTLEVKEVFSIAVTLGSDTNPGLEVDVSGDKPKFKIDSFTIDIEHANLGAIDLKKILLEFENDKIKDVEINVVFPEGWEVDATIKFTDTDPVKIHEIDISYTADNISDAIEIFEGVQLIYLEGDVTNIDKPSELQVSGTIGTIYGGGFTLDGESVTFLEMTDEVVVSSSFFEIKGDVNVGAYKDSDGNWQSILGSGSIDFYAEFGHYIKAEVIANYPGDPLIHADVSAYLDNHGHFDALLDVKFIVPHFVPFIGGKTLGSVDGAVRYKSGDLNNSFGAAWVDIDLWFYDVIAGASFNFGTKDINSIGSGTVNKLKQFITSDEGKGETDNLPPHIYYSFDMPEPYPNAIQIDIDWLSEVAEAQIYVSGPEGSHVLSRVYADGYNADGTPIMKTKENFDHIYNTKKVSFLLKSSTAFKQENTIQPVLLGGRYYLAVFYPDGDAEIDTIQVKTAYQRPTSSIVAVKTDNNKFELTTSFWTTLPESTLVSFYANNTNSYNGSRLINHKEATNYNDSGFGSEQLIYTPHYFESSSPSSQTLYFYSVIEDGVNPPLRSEISEAFSHSPDFYGTLSLSETASETLQKAGLRVFIDNDDDGNFDTASTGGEEPFSLVNSAGAFAFKNVVNGTHKIRVVLPPGYRFVGTTDRYSSKTIDFEGTPLELNLEIETY